MANINGYKRERPTLGKVEDHNVQKYPMPELGTYVLVKQLKILDKDKGEGRITYTNCDRSSPFVDAWGMPKTFEVMGYSRGINNPLDPHNDVILKDTGRSQCVCRLRTIYVATGSQRLIKVNKPIPQMDDEWDFVSYMQEFEKTC